MPSFNPAGLPSAHTNDQPAPPQVRQMSSSQSGGEEEVSRVPDTQVLGSNLTSSADSGGNSQGGGERRHSVRLQASQPCNYTSDGAGRHADGSPCEQVQQPRGNRKSRLA
jgi:hypothetical protein